MKITKTIKFFSLIIGLTFTKGNAQTATVTLTSERQVIRGFGGINHPEWYSDLNAAERQLAFGNGTGQLGFTVLRTFVSDNSSNFSRGIETAKYAFNNGAIVFASPWNPPAGQFITVNNVKRINPATYAQYADHLNSYVTYMKGQGVDLYAISTQNEPDYAHDWTEWSPQESVDFIKGYANRINCRLMSPESFQYRKQVYDPILNDPAALANVDIFGTHLYGTQVSAFPYPLFVQKGAGKELWMTEVYTDSKFDGNLWNDAILTQDQHALRVAEHIHYSMVEGNFQTYVFWPIRRYYALIHDGVSDGQGNTPAAAGTATKRGYCMAQFSKWVRPGYVRVDATKSPSTNVFVSAYKKDNDVVIVVVNKNTGTRSLNLAIPGTKVTSWEQYTTSGSKNLAKGSNINSGASFLVTLDASSVTTFVGKAASGMPTVALTEPVNNATFTAPATVNLAATATDPNGTISKVEFFNGATKLGEDASSPYTYSWTSVAAGTYSITAKATDNSGNIATSTALSIVVQGVKAPFKTAPHVIPGRIEAEDYDLGGQGVAYNEANTSGNQGLATYRTDEVDIETTQDGTGAYNIGYALNGEWLEYTVNVTSAGLYSLELRLAADGAGKSMHVEMDNVNISGAISVPNTAGWQTWQTVTINNLNFTAGQKVMRIAFDSDYMNFNFVEFKKMIPTGFEDEKVGMSAIFPNPFSSDGLQIHKSGSFYYKITDMSGLVVDQGKGFDKQTVGSQLMPGVYSLTLEQNGEVKTHKIIRK